RLERRRSELGIHDRETGRPGHPRRADLPDHRRFPDPVGAGVFLRLERPPPPGFGPRRWRPGPGDRHAGGHRPDRRLRGHGRSRSGRDPRLPAHRRDRRRHRGLGRRHPGLVGRRDHGSLLTIVSICPPGDLAFLGVDPNAITASWSESPEFDGELVDVRHIAARPAIHTDPQTPLRPEVAERLGELGIRRLFRHQARAIDSIRAGRHTVIVAGTAAGKTLCYQVPIMEAVLEDSRSTALCIYPTKALAQDQARSFSAIAGDLVAAATYDGDTPTEDRAAIRRSAGVILTNPDMLHVGILPHHGRWADFLHRLRYVVVDELHTLRGVFGTHVSMVLRRLRRLCHHYGSDPVFVFGSATIGNPGELASRLCGVDVAVIDDDTSPRGEQWVALWNPEMEDPEEGRRRSALAEATDLFVDLVRRDVSTIVFARSRKATELVYRWA